jgi:hypothetical protein
MFQYYIVFLPLLIFAIFALLLFAKKWGDDHRRSIIHDEKLLRSAGDSRRTEIDTIDAKINNCLVFIGIGVAVQIIAFTFLTSTLSGAVLGYLLGIVSVTTVSFTLWYLIKTTILVLKRSRCSDGFHGECITGNQLSVLMLDGYRIFHDLQFEDLNIDHALVGPAGVFAVETKLWKQQQSLKDPVVRFDGEKLHWSKNRINTIGIQEAFDRSIILKQFLSNALGEPVEAKPLLLLPGWNVETEHTGKVSVLNPKQVRTFLKGVEEYDEVISEKQINRICRHLAGKAGYPEPMSRKQDEAQTNNPSSLEMPVNT